MILVEDLQFQAGAFNYASSTCARSSIENFSRFERNIYEIKN